MIRKATRIQVLLLTCVCGSLGTGAWAVAGTIEKQLTDYEQRITVELQKKSPEAAKWFTEANQARLQSEFAKAATLYQRVREKVPTFVHATRRLCGVQQELGNRQEAIRLCRQAVLASDSPENLSALAQTLISKSDGADIPFEERREAVQLAKQAAAKAPEDVMTQLTLCQVALQSQTNQASLMSSCASKLKTLAPDEYIAFIYSALDMLMMGQYELAESELRRAKELGFPEAEYQGLMAQIQKGRSESRTAYKPTSDISVNWLPVMLVGIVCWIGVFVALLIVGWILSAVVMASAKKVPTNRTGQASGVDAVVRKIYRVVLWLCCGYYYISIPLVILTVVVGGGGLIYLFIAMGRIPVKLVIIVAVVALVSIFAVLKSLFVRRLDVDPGELLNVEAHPKLLATLKEVAAKIFTRPVDNVYLTPGTEVAVFERGGMLKQLAGRSERCLVLGIGVLDGMTLLQLKSILAHEYGHFSNQDTAGGGFALAVRRSLFTMAEGLARGGAAAWYNPAWWFVNGFFKAFMRISQGASRLQEVLADRWAAFAYGSKAFIEGLQHVISRSVLFNFQVKDTVGEVVADAQPLANLYTYQPHNQTSHQILNAETQDALERRATAYDSHPAPKDRFAWVEALALERTAHPSDTDPAWSLFSRPEEIQKQMTEQVRTNLAQNHDIVIKGA